MRPPQPPPPWRLALRAACLVLPAALAACGSPSSQRYAGYVGGTVPAECAPFARALSSVQLYGQAADWWWEAQGRYVRTSRPAEGSVLVLRRTNRLPDGHVAVVSRVLSPREILVTQANWVRHRVTEDQPVVDVSPDNDWTRVRLWWPPAGAMGSGDYPAYGFIRPVWPASHQQIIAAVPRTIRLFGGS
jgi:surface antigen